MNFPAETRRLLRALKRNNRREWFEGVVRQHDGVTQRVEKVRTARASAR